MKVIRFDGRDSAPFLRYAQAFLQDREAENNLTLGLASSLERYLKDDSDEAIMGVIESDAGAIMATFFRTPGRLLILSTTDDPDAVADSVVEAISATHSDIPGVNGPKAFAKAFVERWHRSYRLEMPQRIYKLEKVILPREVSGQMRVATLDDLERICDWMVEFSLEAVNDKTAREILERSIRMRIESMISEFYLWCDPEPVAMLSASGRTPNGIRIGAVYTPVDKRKRGYASNLTAYASQDQLNRGRKFCFLYTDLNNPTSNHIYQTIGYEPVIDIDAYHFLDES